MIDSFSRRILAWKACATFDTSITTELLTQAAQRVTFGEKPKVMVDGGVENYNATVDALVERGLLERVLAQVEITFSNSMIEAWWRVLKHNWLYLNQLDTLATVTKHVAFYVEQHNQVLPHAAFKGQTPDEMYSGTGENIPEQLRIERASARVARR